MSDFILGNEKVRQRSRKIENSKRICYGTYM